MKPPPIQLDEVFNALADPTRRAILARLTQGEATVNELIAPFDLAQPTISKHLKVLERAGLVSRGREAQFRPVRLNAAPLAQAARWLGPYSRFWEDSFDKLDALLQSDPDTTKADAPASSSIKPARRKTPTASAPSSPSTSASSKGKRHAPQR